MPLCGKKSLAGLAALVLLLAASCRPEPVAPVQVADAYLRALDRRVAVDFRNQSVAEVLNFLCMISNLNLVVDPSVKVDGSVSMPLRASSLPLGAVLEAWCARVGLGWTIAPSGPRRGAVVSVVIATPGRIAELERADPVTARRLRKCRHGWLRELEAAGHHASP